MLILKSLIYNKERIEYNYELDLEKIEVKKVKKNNKIYIKYPLLLDTETSYTEKNVEYVGWVYQWSFEWYGQIVVGRTPTQLVHELRRIVDSFLQDDEKVVIYVHNLSYDIVYLLQYLYETFGDFKALCIKNHKFVSVVFKNIEFRCSYILSNMSLDEWSKKMNTKHRKLVGTVDYKVKRYQDTDLTETDWLYQIFDVLTLRDSLYEEMKFSGDTVATIPLTSTGFVRRDCRLEVSKDKEYRKWFKNTALDVNTYKIARKAFAGGDVHGNRFYRGKTVETDIAHYDYKSHYPSCQMLRYFPITKFIPLYLYNVSRETLKLADFVRICNEKCVLATLQFENMKLKKGITAPVLSYSKLIGDYRAYKDNGVNGTDNGRIINMQGRGKFTGTELDFKWIFKQYDIDFVVIESVYIADRGEFPEQIKKQIHNYFSYKEILEEGVLRMKSKNKLNAIYGMSATDIVRDEHNIDIETMEFDTVKKLDDEDIEKALTDFYKNRNSFMPYQFGVWTTAHARDQLHTMIERIGYEKFLYCDTDSIFFIDNEESRKTIEDFNKAMSVKCLQKDILHVKNKSGGISCFGVFEDEKDNIKKFRFLHAKCYAFEDGNGELHTTIAGVAKSNKKIDNDRVTISDELGSIENLYDGFTFIECGSTISKYVYSDITTEYIDGHLIDHASACIIENTTKTLGNSLETIFEMEVL